MNRYTRHIKYEFLRLEACKEFLLPDEYHATMDEYGDPIPEESAYRIMGMTHVAGTSEEKQYEIYLTAFTVLTRNLLAFFFDKRKDGGTDDEGNDRVGNDDVIVADYFPEGRWSAPVVPGKDGKWRAGIREQVNKLTAHITYTRVQWSDEDGEERMRWLVPEIFDYLSVLWRDFEAIASRELNVV